MELEGVVAVGETVRAKINVLGGGEYDYANFPELKIAWRYLTAADYSAGNTDTNAYKEITGTTGRAYTIPENMAGNYLSFLLYDTVSREYKMLSSPVRIATAEERLLKADASALTLDTSDIRAATTLTLPESGAVNGSAITWTSSDSSIIDPATGAVTLPASGIQTVTLSATLTRGDATAHRNFDICVWSQAELDKEAAKSELRKLVERLDGTITLTPEYGQDTNVNTMLSAKLDDSSIAVSVSRSRKCMAVRASRPTAPSRISSSTRTPRRSCTTAAITSRLRSARPARPRHCRSRSSSAGTCSACAMRSLPRSRASSPPRACAPPGMTRTCSRRI